MVCFKLPSRVSRLQTTKSSKPTSAAATRIVRALLLLAGTLLIGYAISDHPLYGGKPGFGSSQIVISAAGVGLALCALLPTRIASNILLLTITSLVMLAFIEIAGEILLGPRFRPIYQYDDKLIFKFIPNRNSVMTRTPVNGGETVTHHINSDGFRGPELLPPGKAVRVVVYGDSFMPTIAPKMRPLQDDSAHCLQRASARKLKS